MRIIRSVFFILLISVLFGYSEVSRHYQYTTLSRFTDPGAYSFMLDGIPDDVNEMCKLVKNLSIHYNLQYYYGIDSISNDPNRNVWSPGIEEFLANIQAASNGELFRKRTAREKICGSCVKDAYLLSGMLRHENKKARIRAGFFKDVREDTARVMQFWDKVSKTKAKISSYSEEETMEWMALNRKLTRMQNLNKHYIEHWICEYWDENSKSWILLDPNNLFLKYHSGIEIGFKLPYKHFEFAHNAWIHMRKETNFNEASYSEDIQDGRSHIRSQLLWDFYSLLNHDLAGYGSRNRDIYNFILKRKYDELSENEFRELDKLAYLLSRNAEVDELVRFYYNTYTLRIDELETDPYSFARFNN